MSIKSFSSQVFSAVGHEYLNRGEEKAKTDRQTDSVIVVRLRVFLDNDCWGVSRPATGSDQ